MTNINDINTFSHEVGHYLVEMIFKISSQKASNNKANNILRAELKSFLKMTRDRTKKAITAMSPAPIVVIVFEFIVFFQ